MRTRPLGAKAASSTAPPRDRSMVWVASGLGIFGVANFAFLALAGRDLGATGSAPVSVAWTLLNAIGIGLFQPLEQETSRRLAAARTRGAAGARLGRMVRYALITASTIVAVGLLALPWLGDSLFDGARELVPVLILGLLGQALAYFARGVLAGNRQFRSYGAQLAVDGSLRIGAATLLFYSGSGTRLTYGLILVVVPVVATLVTVKATALLRVWRNTDGEDFSTPMPPLVANSTASQLLANFGAIAMALLATSAQSDLTGSFVSAIAVARIPLFLFAAVQAVFLPALATLHAGDDIAGFRRAVNRAFLATFALGVLGVVGIAVLGQWIFSIFGGTFLIGTNILVLIAASGALFMLAQVFAQALLAHHEEGSASLAWSAGIIISILTLLGPWELAIRVALALCTGAGAALVVLAYLLHRRLRLWAGKSSLVPSPSTTPRGVA